MKNDEKKTSDDEGFTPCERSRELVSLNDEKKREEVFNSFYLFFKNFFESLEENFSCFVSKCLKKPDAVFTNGVKNEFKNFFVLWVPRVLGDEYSGNLIYLNKEFFFSRC